VVPSLPSQASARIAMVPATQALFRAVISTAFCQSGSVGEADAKELDRHRNTNARGSFFGMYRWHITDPVRFKSDLRVTIQALGWHTGRKTPRSLILQDDIASVAYWYQTLPTAPFPPRHLAGRLGMSTSDTEVRMPPLRKPTHAIREATWDPVGLVLRQSDSSESR